MSEFADSELFGVKEFPAQRTCDWAGFELDLARVSINLWVFNRNGQFAKDFGFACVG